MAIRSGSGSLKYPLPNRAQIQAQQNAAAASAGGSASASAYGANLRYAGLKKQLQYNAIESANDRMFRAGQAYLDRGFRAEQAFFDREHDKGSQLEAQRSAAERQAAQFQQQREMQWEGQYFDAEQARQNRDFTMERDQVQFQQDQTQFERQVDAGIEADIRSGKLVLPPAAQRRLEELDATKAGREAQGLDGEQLEEFNAIYEQERRKAIRQATQPSGPSTTGRANEGQTFYDPQTGTFFEEMGPGRIPGSVTQDGQFQPTVAGDTKADEQQQKQFEYNRKRMEDLIGQPIPNKPGEFFDIDSAAEQVQKEQETAAGRFSPQGAGQSGGATAAGAGGRMVVRQSGAQGGEAPMGMGESVQARSGPVPITDVSTAEKNLGQLPTPMTAQERDGLKPGELYLTPTGEMRRRK